MNGPDSAPGRLAMLEQRVRALEQQNQRLRRSRKATHLMLVPLAVVAVVVATIAARPNIQGEVLTVRGLNVVDGEGIERITLGTTSDTVTQSATLYGRTLIRRAPAGAYVLFFDDEGTEQGGIGIPDDGGIFYGFDSRTGQNISLGTSADGRSAAIRFWTVAGGERHEAMLGIDAEAGPTLTLSRAGEVVFQAPDPSEEGNTEEDDNG